MSAHMQFKIMHELPICNAFVEAPGILGGVPYEKVLIWLEKFYSFMWL
jgi:hypothetical protein